MEGKTNHERDFYTIPEECYTILTFSHYLNIFECGGDLKDGNGQELLTEKELLTLNQIEFILMKLSKACEPVFRKTSNQVRLSTLILYGFGDLVAKNSGAATL